MIKDNRIKNNGGRNTSYYKSKVGKAKKKNNNFLEKSRKRQMSSYIRAISVVGVLMFVVICFIMLGVYLKNLTAGEEAEQNFAAISTEEPSISSFAMPVAEEAVTPEPFGASDVYTRFQGAYLDIQKLENLESLQNFIDRLKLKEINAVTIDIKKEDGIIPFHINGQFTAVVGEENQIDLKIQDIIAMLRENNLYVSGRIVCFKDNLASRNFLPIHALTESSTGLLFADYYDSAWLNIYSEEARQYIKNLVAETVQLGFDEIVLDYFYLPNVSDLSRLTYNDGGTSKNDAVKNFVTEVRGVINEFSPEVKLGLNFPIRYFVNMPSNSMGLNPNELISVCDFFTTSFAPSDLLDLPQGAINISNPESSPYEAVKAVSAKFVDIAGKIMLRPDLQAFDSANGVIYDDTKILNQRQALSEAGISVWTLINYDNNY